MIIVLGGSGYVGSAYLDYLGARGLPVQNIRRSEVDYYDPAKLEKLLRETKAGFLINTAGFTGKPNVDACELHKADTLLGNAVLPGKIRQACEVTGTPWGHVSSGCIYSGRREDGEAFTEEDPPNFSFRCPPCSFYSGSKALGEEVLEGAEGCYVWRLRIPFDHGDTPRNYLIKLMRYTRLLEAENSISHLGEFVRATFETHEKGLPFGTYNVVQPGAVTTRQVTEWILEEGKRRKAAGQANPFPERFDFFENEEVFMREAAQTPRSNCVLDPGKILGQGIHLTPVEDAVRAALRDMHLEPAKV